MNTNLLEDPNDYEHYNDVDKALDEFLLTSEVKEIVDKAIKRINRNIRKEKIKRLLNENN